MRPSLAPLWPLPHRRLWAAWRGQLGGIPRLFNRCNQLSVAIRRVHRRYSSLGHPQPATLPPVPINEWTLVHVDQFTASGHTHYQKADVQHVPVDVRYLAANETMTPADGMALMTTNAKACCQAFYGPSRQPRVRSPRTG